MTAIPSDRLGSYPELAGWTPLETGRRVLVALLDTLIALGFSGLGLLATHLLNERTGIAAGAVSLVYLVLSLWAWFGKSSRLAGVLMKAQYLDVRTGRPSGGKLVLKFLLTTLLAIVTLGLAPLIMVFATIEPPLLRNWFDRRTGLILVDRREGRRPATDAREQLAPISAVAYPAPAPYPGLAAQAPAAPQSAAPSGAASGPIPEAPAVIQPPSRQDAPSPFAPPVRPPAPEATEVDAPMLRPTSSFDLEAQYRSRAVDADAPVQRVIETGGLITGAPGVRSGAPARPAPFSPPARRPAPIVRDMHSVAADSPAEPRAAQGEPQAVLADGTVLDLTTSVVLGRNPSAPGSAPDAVPVPVDDPLASKTHVQFGRDERGVWVLDLHSTNGVFVVRSGAEPERIAPSARVPVVRGDQVLFADQTVTIR